VASTNNRIRIPSRKILSEHAAAAAGIGAHALIVHGGHVTQKDDPAVGVDNWRKTFERAKAEGGFPLQILIENTAGGDNAMARRFDRLAMLWDVVGEYGVGFVLDTCHAWAGGEELAGIAERVRAITGRIDLVHANNSRDAFDSGADRHANFDSGTFDSELIAAVCRDAGTDVIVETPGGPEGQGADLEYLRKHLR
jgi:deoxyribonuclease IV